MNKEDVNKTTIFFLRFLGVKTLRKNIGTDCAIDWRILRVQKTTLGVFLDRLQIDGVGNSEWWSKRRKILLVIVSEIGASILVRTTIEQYSEYLFLPTISTNMVFHRHPVVSDNCFCIHWGLAYCHSDRILRVSLSSMERSKTLVLSSWNLI